jgi:hypothetical protein
MLPARDAFTLYVTLENGPRMVASRDGTVSTAQMKTSATGMQTAGPLRLGPTAGYDGLCFGIGGFTYQTIEVRWSAAGITGTVKGTAEYITGDVVQAVPFTGTLTGTPDRTPPTASFAGTAHHPLDRVALQFSEALAAGTSASLVAPDGSKIALQTDGTPNPARFFTPGPLRAGTSYRIDIQPELADLSGNTGDPATLPMLTTTNVPLVPEDGFEGSTAPLLAGATIAGAPEIPPLAGGRSLLFPPRGPSTFPATRFTARLAVSPTDRVVRATVRMIVTNKNWRAPQTHLTLTTLGGARSSAMLPEAADPLSCDPAVTGTGCYAAPVSLEIPLPATGAGEVMVDVDRELGCGLPPPPEPGFLLDDLRVE